METYSPRTILITVRASPEPSQKYNETSCVAGIDMDSKKPIRLFPIPARALNDTNRFRKYSIIQASVRKATSDTRPESHNVDSDSISELERIDTGPKSTWAKRNDLVAPFRVSDSLEELRSRYDQDRVAGTPSLTLLRPSLIEGFDIQPKDQDGWTEDELAKLSQMNFFDTSSQSRRQLEFIPYRFIYRFRCQDPQCTGHRCQVLDWEIAESYRQWKAKYGDQWEWAIRNKYEHEFMNKKDLQFFMGTTKAHPKNWTIIGLYYPGKQS